MLRSPVGLDWYGDGGGMVVRSRGFGASGVSGVGTGGFVSKVEFLMPYLKYMNMPGIYDKEPLRNYFC